MQILFGIFYLMGARLIFKSHAHHVVKVTLVFWWVLLVAYWIIEAVIKGE